MRVRVNFSVEVDTAEYKPPLSDIENKFKKFFEHGSFKDAISSVGFDVRDVSVGEPKAVLIVNSTSDKIIVEQMPFRHPGDWYLTMVLCLVGNGQPDTRQWVTWYYNHECPGFNEGHYFRYDEEAEARKDYVERCLRYC